MSLNKRGQNYLCLLSKTNVFFISRNHKIEINNNNNNENKQPPIYCLFSGVSSAKIENSVFLNKKTAAQIKSLWLLKIPGFDQGFFPGKAVKFPLFFKEIKSFDDLVSNLAALTGTGHCITLIEYRNKVFYSNNVFKNFYFIDSVLLAMFFIPVKISASLCLYSEVL